MILMGPDRFLDLRQIPDLLFSYLFCGAIGFLDFAGQLVAPARKLAQVIIGQLASL